MCSSRSTAAPFASIPNSTANRIRLSFADEMQRLKALADPFVERCIIRCDLESADSEEVKYTPPVTDKDGDGMPDDWEVHFGLNPLVDDADGDLDGDGIANRDEFRAGLEPDDPGVGAAPTAPEPLSPESYTRVKPNPLLIVGDYSDVDGDAHIATHWQV
jgi:hypothetical protein